MRLCIPRTQRIVGHPSSYRTQRWSNRYRVVWSSCKQPSHPCRASWRYRSRRNGAYPHHLGSRRKRRQQQPEKDQRKNKPQWTSPGWSPKATSPPLSPLLNKQTNKKGRRLKLENKYLKNAYPNFLIKLQLQLTE